jgi:hypothetical protein
LEWPAAVGRCRNRSLSVLQEREGLELEGNSWDRDEGGWIVVAERRASGFFAKGRVVAV